MNNVRDVESALMSSENNAEEFWERFEVEFYKPDALMMMRLLDQGMQPWQKDMLYSIDPANTAEVEKLIYGKEQGPRTFYGGE